jgi:hypothetical protein
VTDPNLDGARRWVSPALTIGLTLVVVLQLLSLLNKYYVDVLYMDAWEMVPLVDKTYRGAETFNDFWKQANEHRPVFPRLILTPLARLTHWNTHAEVALNLSLGVLMLLTVILYARRIWPSAAAPPFWTIPLAALFIFGPGQYENWLWGWEFVIFLQVAAGFIGLYLLTRPASGWLMFTAAMVLGIVGSYSFGNGLMFWPAGCVALLLVSHPRRNMRLAVFAAIAAVTVGLYMYGWKPNPGHPSVGRNFESLGALWYMTKYYAIYLGTSVCGFSQRGAMCAGFAGLALFVWVCAEAMRRRDELAWPLALQIAVVAGALLTAAGRAGFGTPQAMSSRYQTISMPFWVAGTLFLSMLVSSGGRFRQVRTAVPIVLVCAIAVSASVTAVTSEASWRRWNAELAPAREALRTNGDGLLQTRLYPDPVVVTERRLMLLRHRLLVFRRGAAASSK